MQSTIELSTPQSHRAAGVLLGQACGDALGVPYEFGPALPATFAPQMAGGGPFGFAAGDPVVSRVLLVTLIYMAAFSGMESTFGLWADSRYDWGAREVGWTFAVVGVVAGAITAAVSAMRASPRATR